ncbi:MAG: heparinase II/III family protein, partial [Candidatus Hydrogenedentes bacterium]|nr:heparinase II/III family protein [Candidatus Hydrogenedentota bacterium]
HSDPFGAISHAHADQNAFTIEAFGEALAIVSGYYPWYGSDHHRNWQWESKSSNTITFDGGIGQVVRDAKSKGRIVAFLPGNAYDYVEADASAAYQGRLSRCVRKVVHLRPGVFILFDDVAAPEPHTLEWRLHALSEMTLDEDFQRLTVAQGDARMAVRLFYGENLAFSQTSEFEYPPERGGDDQYHFVASTPGQVTAIRLVTVLMPYRKGAENALPVVEPVLCDAGRAVRIKDSTGVHLVAFRTAPDKPKWGVEVLDTDADVFAVHFKPDGTADHALLHNGTYINEALPNGTTRPIATSQ